MREARTINDVKELLTDHTVIPVLDAHKVYLVMNPSLDWEPDINQKVQVAIRSKNVLETDDDKIAFQKNANNAIIDLVHNPQFWRCTTVADQMSRFYGFDGGSMPPMFMRGENRSPSREWRMTGLTKKGGEPFTIHFESPEAAVKFITAVAGDHYHVVRMNIEQVQLT